MPTFIALLRGVNVGKAKRVPMAEFRVLLADLGYTEVATLLNSGNAIFHAPKGAPAEHATNIAAALISKLNVEVPVIVKPARELAAIVAESPIKVEPALHSHFLIAFTQDAQGLRGLAVIRSLVEPPEQFVIGRHAAYLFCARGLLESEAGASLLGKAGRAATTRNWATTLKLHALANKVDA